MRSKCSSRRLAVVLLSSGLLSACHRNTRPAAEWCVPGEKPAVLCVVHGGFGPSARFQVIVGDQEFDVGIGDYVEAPLSPGTHTVRVSLSGGAALIQKVELLPGDARGLLLENHFVRGLVLQPMRIEELRERLADDPLSSAPVVKDELDR